MTPEDFDALFDSFTHSAVRYEGLGEYRVGGAEAERLAAFQAGHARPLRSVGTDPWLARIATTTLAGKTWGRIRVVDTPLTDYQRYQLASHVEAQAVGEQVFIARRSDIPGSSDDFWLFDRDTPTAHAVLMSYAADGRWLGAELTTDPTTLARLGGWLDSVRAVAVTLNEFLAVAGA